MVWCVAMCCFADVFGVVIGCWQYVSCYDMLGDGVPCWYVCGCVVKLCMSVHGCMLCVVGMCMVVLCAWCVIVCCVVYVWVCMWCVYICCALLWCVVLSGVPGDVYVCCVGVVRHCCVMC